MAPTGWPSPACSSGSSPRTGPVYPSCTSSSPATRPRAITCRSARCRTCTGISPRASPGTCPGVGSFADRRFGGGKLNERTTEDRVELTEIGGEEYLFYKTFPINVAIIRGTTADPAGNITMEREALTCDTLSVAMAAHNSGGLVIAQVERLAEANSLNPRQVKIPGALVDCIVVATDQKNHPQTFGSPYNPAFAAEVRVPLTSLTPLSLSARKIIARRGAMELRPNSVVNLGFGIPEGVASVAAEEKIADLMTLTAEPGAIGGLPAGGGDFGGA